jgi:hypothetical protein
MLCVIVLSVVASCKHAGRWQCLHWTKAGAFYSENYESELEQIIFVIDLAGSTTISIGAFSIAIKYRTLSITTPCTYCNYVAHC